MTVRHCLAAFVSWLRRPQRVIDTATRFLAEHHVRTLADLERAASLLSIPLIRADIGLREDGLTGLTAGGPAIFIRPDLHRMRYEFTLAHEMGHAQLHPWSHGQSACLADRLEPVGGTKDTEADLFLFVCLVSCMNAPELPSYALSNPNMASRCLRMLLFLLFYRLRCVTADGLEKLFTRTTCHGAI